MRQTVHLPGLITCGDRDASRQFETFLRGAAVCSGRPRPLARSNAIARAGREPVAEFLLHPTGETSAQLMIVATASLPLRMMFPGSNALRWLIDRRRRLGLGAFACAAFHAILYLVDMENLHVILGEFLALGIWTGWFAFVILLLLALTPNDFSVRWLGRR